MNDTDRTIFNCHNHTFTHQNIPNNYFPFGLVPLARNKGTRWVMNAIMKGIVPWTKNDKIHRYTNFIRAAYRKTQQANLEHLISYYPKGTRFVILPMDMELMGAGKVIEKIDAQHAELARLGNSDRFKDVVIAFAHIDPRQGSSLQRLKKLVEEDGFKGVKIYPTLGYGPDHPVLMNEIYPYMVEKNIPLMAHCSPGSVNSHDLPKKDAHRLADPENYVKVMTTHPDLKICLGHFGGIGEWERQLDGPGNIEKPTWVEKICTLLKSERHPNLFTDISYTIFNFQGNVAYLNVLLNDPRIASQVLFGSDFYMVEDEKYSEKRLSVDLRDRLGEDKFWQIANTNPRRYLGL